MSTASAKAERSATNRTGKAVWQKPQIKKIAISDEFDPASGDTLAEWLAGRELKARAAQRAPRKGTD